MYELLLLLNMIRERILRMSFITFPDWDEATGLCGKIFVMSNSNLIFRYTAPLDFCSSSFNFMDQREPKQVSKRSWNFRCHGQGAFMSLKVEGNTLPSYSSESKFGVSIWTSTSLLHLCSFNLLRLWLEIVSLPIHLLAMCNSVRKGKLERSLSKGNRVMSSASMESVLRWWHSSTSMVHRFILREAESIDRLWRLGASMWILSSWAAGDEFPYCVIIHSDTGNRKLSEKMELYGVLVIWLLRIMQLENTIASWHQKSFEACCTIDENHLFY